MFGLTTAALLFGYTIFASSSPTIEIRQAGSGASAFSPPWYTTPPGGTSKSWELAYQKAARLVSQMTVLEKVNITTGLGWGLGPCVGNTGPVPRLGFPSLCLQDGPLGIRLADKITAFPAGITVAGTWDRQLMRLRAEALGAEFKGKGVNIALGPSMGPLGKIPTAGRNWEGFGSDPYLQGVAAFETVLGIQSQGVIATAKHYIGNEQEHYRLAISSNIDDRTLHEVYLWPFQNSVKAGVGAVMCSYQKVNNSAACQNSYLQNHILKDELGFQGFIMSDWLAQRSGVASLLAGMDMSMPGDGYLWGDGNPMMGPRLTQAVVNGSLPIDRLDDMVTRIVAVWYQLGQDCGHPGVNFSSWTKNDTGNIYPGSSEPPTGIVNRHVDVMGDHPRIARKIAAEAISLLKNDRRTLPLKKPLKIGVYGEDAALAPGGPNVCPDQGCNQGTLASGWGSGSAEFDYLVDPLSAIKEKAGSYGGTVTSILQNNETEKIAASSKKQDICIAFINADSGEGYISWKDVDQGDRPNLNAQNGGDELVLAVANNCKKTIVVIHAVGPIVMEKWVQKPQVRSILWAHLPGLESGNSLVDVLWGAVNPSGKLPYTIGKTLADYGPGAQLIYNDTSKHPQQDFTDGIFIDYRHFDKEGIKPRYEFGFGLSYTTFSYGRLARTERAPVTPYPAKRPAPESQPPVYNSTIPAPSEVLYPRGFKKIKRMIYPYLESVSNITRGPYPYPDGYQTRQTPSEAGGSEGGNPSLWDILVEICVTITNTGQVAGAEVAQLYLEFPKHGPVTFPKNQLRGFQKVFLQPGESKEIKFELTRRDLSYWDVTRQNWVIPQPGICVNVGTSSRRIKSQGYIHSMKPSDFW